MAPLEEFQAFLETVDPADGRLIVRWVDEMRPVPEAAGGFTVKQVVQLTVTARVDGGPAQKTFEGLRKEDISPVLAGQRFKLTLRSGNTNR